MQCASCVLKHEQKEMYLDEALVVQQLRYTGMLETVRIRRSGYGAKYTFQVPQSYSSFRKIHVINHKTCTVSHQAPKIQSFNGK